MTRERIDYPPRRSVIAIIAAALLGILSLMPIIGLIIMHFYP